MSIAIPIRKPASPDVIARIERAAGHELPHSYLRFLQDHDGATPEDNVVESGKGRLGGADVETFIPADEILQIRDRVEGFPKNMLPIARSAGGNLIYLDPAVGKIYFWEHESDSENAKLADSFEEFLAAIRPFDDSQIKLKPGQVISVWVDPDFKPEF